MAEIKSLSILSDSSVQGYWKLEDVNDSKNSFNLTNNGTVTFTSAVYNNGANLGTSNTTKYLSILNALNVDGGACSWVGWVKILTEIGAGSYILFQQNNGTSKSVNEIHYEYNGGTRRLIFRRSKVGIADNDVPYNLTMGTSSFYHLACTYDGSSIHGYVNGADIGNIGSTGSGSGARTTGLTIGADITAASYASALFDDVLFASRALTPVEIQGIYLNTGNFLAFM